MLMIGTAAVAQTSSGQIYGKITDEETGEELIGANILFEKNGVFAGGSATDFEGNFSISVDAGTYDATISYTGYSDNKITGVLVKSGQNTKLDITLSQGVTLEEVVVRGYVVPLIEQDNTTSGQTITAEQIQNLPTKNITALAASAAGASQADEGDDVNIKGSRDNATDYYIDGIRVRGAANLIPQSEIDQLQIITGGIEAQYGDVTGGIISITTKGPSANYSGGLEVETSEFLDAFGYNLLSANVSGPILKNKQGESIIGFRVSGQYLDLEDDDPTAVNVFQVNDEKLAELEANPISVIGSSVIPTAETLTEDDVNVLDAQPNERSTRYDFTAKIDARLTKGIDVTFTGAYNYSENKFTPFENSRTRANWRLLNSHNNPTSFESQYRGNFRFRHRLGVGGLKSEGDGESSDKTSVIQNAEYTIQGGYEKRLFERYDSRHEDRFFDYGYIGNFANDYVPQVDDPDNDGIFQHVGYAPQLTGFTPGTQNPVLVNYNNISDLGDFNDFVAINGQYRGNVTSAWGFHTNVGQIYNRFEKIDNDIVTINVKSSFDLLPGGSEKGRHSIQFGINYEQRFNRNYILVPRTLWQVARQQVNRNILGPGTDTIGWITETGIPGVDSVALVNSLTENPDELLFYRRARDITGQALDEFVNIDGINPDQLSLDMFSAQELTDVNLVDYYGFDHTGQLLGNNVGFDDFFTAEENGIRTFPVAPFNPIYFSAYIQDKFTFKDIIFRLGLRVDRFDANTKVLKDIYSLYDIQTAGEFYDQTGRTQPAAVQDDYKVYTEGEESEIVKAFRKGDQWYDANGTAVNGGNVIFGGQVVTPRLKNPDANIKEDGFNPDESFEDYKPQFNWMPRLAFSFPISDEANFFAHYDILVQRPPSNAISTALDYYYFNERPGSETAPFDNSNLRPERTIDYEVGFQQKLGNSSAIKLAAYYKELRDMIQRRTVLFVPAPVNNYVTYDNLDFGTVKGFTFQYDLRRTGNVSLQANYTLQFADGTGSDADSQRGITSRGNLRSLFPLSFDERHRIVATLDYRYGSGKNYNGPRLFGKDILSKFGVNIQTIGVSGRPFTAKFLPEKFDGSGTVGQLNGSRLPWNFTVNLRIDKSFNLVKNPDKRQLGLNVYFRVQNALDRRNTIAVYPSTGSPSDDGYLSSSFGLDELETLERSNRDVQAFLSSYQWRILNPNFFALPRRMYLGAIFEF
ncbi:MAG: carboxypeptidase-like regulatory domain-containing protein [Bacteroidota bacterium]